MKILVIGSNGFIGSSCVTYFSKNNNKVWGADINGTSLNNFFLLEKENTNFEAIFSNQTFDVCINASGSANVAFSFENPAIDFELNVLNVHKILVALRRYNPNCKFINFSSAAVYGNLKTLPVSEQSSTTPLSPYGFHKLQSEYLLTEYHNFFGLKTCSVRVFSAYGIGVKKQLFWDLYQKHLQNNKIEIFGTGNESRDFIYIDDLVNVIDLIIENSRFEGDVINVASGIETTIKKAADLFYNYLDPNAKYSFSGKIKMGDPINWRADINIISKMGFISKYPIEEGLKKYVAWLKK